MKSPLFMTILTAIMGMTSNSWLLVWLMLELNSPMFSTMMIFMKENYSTPLNYFIVQALPSLAFLMIVIYSLMTHHLPNKIFTSNTLIMTTALMKMGMIPFHNWMTLILKKLKKSSTMILLTIQKALPLKILSMSMLNSYFFFIMTLNLAGSSLLINQTLKLNNILLASSMFNIMWISLNLNLSLKLSLVYFIIYSYLTMYLIIQSTKVNISLLNMNHNMTNFNLITSILSISGIPPLWGFMNKLMMINLMVYSNTPKTIILALLISSILMLSGYLKIVTSILMSNLKKKSKLMKEKLWNTTFNILMPFTLTAF